MSNRKIGVESGTCLIVMCFLHSGRDPRKQNFQEQESFMSPVAEARVAKSTQDWGGLVEPHGGSLVDLWVTGSEADALRSEAKDLPLVTLTDTQTSDLEMLAVGAMSPLAGFLGENDYRSVVSNCRLADGTVWSMPITLRVNEAPASVGERVALAAEDGTLVAVMDVTDIYEGDKTTEARNVYGTDETEHPGVAILMSQGDTIIGGPLKVFASRENVHGEWLLTPAESRAYFQEKGWNNVVGFQTRNPIHRAHEYLIKCALEMVDGAFIHPLVGRTKDGDIPAEVRMECYQVLLSNYFPSDRTRLGVFPAAMRYAGPREAIFHAMCRKNYGCSHFIVGRDHAGVGSYYGTYDAQAIFEQFSADEVGMTILKFEHSFWCKACGGMASTKTCPHAAEDRVFLSGTKVREMLGNGEIPPVEFTRPEIAEVLIAAYSNS